MSFKAYVIRHSDKELKNFITVGSIGRELFTADCWKRNDIKAVHVLADTMAFVASSPDRLRELMLPLQNSVEDNIPDVLKKRTGYEEALAPTHDGADRISIKEARKHSGPINFEQEVANHAR